MKFCPFQSEITVKLGYNSQPYDPKGQDYSIKRVQIHPEFKNDSSLRNDIALISLSQRIKINNLVNPICLPEASVIDKIDKGKELSNNALYFSRLKLFFTISDDSLTLSGFGLAYNNLTGLWERPTFLQLTQNIHKLPMSNCAGVDSNFSGYFCAGDGKNYEQSRQFTPDSCQGDSGSPLSFKDPFTNRFKLVGLVSFGSKQCGITRGSVYVNVTHYLEWIQRSKLLDAVEDYKENEELPYHKMDNGILREMFKLISSLK